eukprot:jgi/Orpsp1_1/1180641/evm.model.c7180000074188.2
MKTRMIMVKIMKIMKIIFMIKRNKKISKEDFQKILNDEKRKLFSEEIINFAIKYCIKRNDGDEVFNKILNYIDDKKLKEQISINYKINSHYLSNKVFCLSFRTNKYDYNYCINSENYEFTDDSDDFYSANYFNDSCEYSHYYNGKSFSLSIREENNNCVPTYKDSKLTLSSDCYAGYYLTSDDKAIDSSSLDSCTSEKKCKLFYCKTEESKEINCYEDNTTNSYILFKLNSSKVLSCSGGSCNVVDSKGYYINKGYDKTVNTVIKCNKNGCDYYTNDKIQNTCAYSKVGGVVRIESKLYFCSTTDDKGNVEISTDNEEVYQKATIGIGSTDPFTEEVLTNSKTYLLKTGKNAMVVIPE